jgi:uncharacterized membrane-anchored protein YitT (DUF2179 family)
MLKMKRKILLDYVIITIGMFIFACAWTIFLTPNEIVGGGVIGICAMILYTAHIPLEYPYFILNLALFVVGVRIFGKQFGIKTFYGIAVSSLFLRYLPMVLPHEIIEQVLEDKNLLLWALVGGIFEGVGIGLAFMRGGNSGGTDIIALIVNKYKHMAPGRVLLLCDIVIIGSSVFLPDRKIISVIYGFTMVAVATYVIDLIVVGAKQSMQILIFSERNEQIADRITSALGRGVTIVPVIGWYTKKEKKMLLVVVRKYEAVLVYRIVKEIDRTAFLSTSSVTSVYGEGFDPIKDGKISHEKQQHI